MSRRALVIKPGGGKILAVGDSQIAFKLTREEADGLAVFEHRLAPGSDTQLHVHRKIEELFYVLEGELTFVAGEQKVRGCAGTFVFVPPGVPHRVSNPTQLPARTLVMVAPPGLEKYFEELSRMFANSAEPTDDQILRLRDRYDIDHLGES